MALVKDLPIFQMAAIINLYQQMLTGVRLRLEASRDNDEDNLKGQGFSKIKFRST